MPLIYVTMKKGKPLAYRQALAAGIQKAMIDVLGIPEDDYSQVTLQVEPEDMTYDSHFFGLDRGPDVIFIDMSFNQRPPAMKKKLYEAIADNITANPGINRADMMITIKETAPENWWVHGRTTDPETGFDSRMSQQAIKAATG